MPLSRMNSKLNSQRLCRLACYTVSVGLAATAICCVSPAVLGQTPATLYGPAPENFTSQSHVVSTTVFHWFTPTSGQLSGPWRPAEGRSAWTGDAAFWQDQVKQIMSANIDIMYVHLIPLYEDQRVNLFQALNQLRSQGYDVPKVAPWLDPVITWDQKPTLNLATTAAKDDYVSQFTRFFNQYYSVNKDPFADSYLAQMNGRVELDTWHLKFNATHINSLTRSDVESRLSAALGTAHPVFSHGIYQLSTSLNTPTISWADERLAQFESSSYFVQTTYNGHSGAQVKPGYWDQNFRNPGSILPRNGGAQYNQAWQSVHNDSSITHVNIESWNEYDEGSGIYRANTGPPFIRPGSGNTNTDTWSKSNDPLQYVKATADNARVFNDTPDRDSQILSHNLPTHMKPGEAHDYTVTVRNMGDLSWTGSQHFVFGQQESRAKEVVFAIGRAQIDDLLNEISIYGGIFRGRPVTFTLHLVAPTTPGTYLTHWSMLQEQVKWFGQRLDWSITVDPLMTSLAMVPEPSTLALLFLALPALLWRMKRGIS